MDSLFMLFVGIGFVIMAVSIHGILKSNLKMHEAHSKMINILFDHLLDDKKAEVENALNIYRQMQGLVAVENKGDLN